MNFVSFSPPQLQKVESSAHSKKVVVSTSLPISSKAARRYSFGVDDRRRGINNLVSVLNSLDDPNV